ncbi:MAG TPA: hypothetical protein ENN65_08455 [Candidatus Hydrogenedentes bacterium]|nr:hypothetical protein [Candidatus Hydrogenedentota bacterium]
MLTIEDGTGVPGADTFIDLAECADLEVRYFGQALDRSEAEKEAALRRAFLYLGALEWRADAFPLFSGDIPDAVKAAQMALARAEAQSVGFLTPDVTLSGKKVLTGGKGITWTVQAAPNTVEAARPVVTFAMDLLRPYLVRDPAQSGGTRFLERA